jgi:hypothetical protein
MERKGEIKMHTSLQKLFDSRIEQFVSTSRNTINFQKAIKKIDNLAKRNAEIVKAKAAGRIIEREEDGEFHSVKYLVHYQFLIKQKGTLFQEEEVETRMCKFYRNDLIMDEEVIEMNELPDDSHLDRVYREDLGDDSERISYKYDRLKAVQYAERWWNSYNPAYQKFENDCTNFISQCLRAGGAPMRGNPNRGNGWWYQSKNWSYSWSVAHALRIYLGNSKSGLRAKEVSSPDQLMLGDVICYDFEGDGRYNHNTIVTGKDAAGMPLVNAHTYNSRARYWAYEDSSAYTPNIKYKFFSIIDG